MGADEAMKEIRWKGKLERVGLKEEEKEVKEE